MAHGSQEILLRNNTGSKSKSVLIEGFVVRTSELQQVKTGLETAKSVTDIQNTIFIGQRGAGKTTLLHRLNYAILDEKNLADRYLPIVFSEEQYYLSDLTNLWEAIAASIDDNFYKDRLTKKINDIIEGENDFQEKVFSYLKDFLNQKKKIAILFIENVNFFLKKLSEKERQWFKSVLLSNCPFRIIGSSTTYNDGTIDFGSGFYNFVNFVFLDGLSQKECEKLLIKIGQQYGEEDQIKEVINSHPGRVEALRRLTGGVPRTISYLFQIFLDNENGKAIKDLYLLIDTLTLLYKSELDQLSTQQQKVVDAIARKWDAISVKEIVKQTRLESKNVSSILSYLEKNQVIEKVPTSTKNHFYRIKERFMNIWYLMRFGRKHDKDNVIWLVRFFDAWCDESELTKRIKRHIDNLKDGKYDLAAAIDMGNTFLSCENISESLKEELIKTTNSILPERLLKSAKTSQQDVLKDIKNLIKENKYADAISMLESVEDRNVDYYMLATSIYLKTGDFSAALSAASSAVEKDDKNPYVLISAAIIHDLYLGDTDKAIELYKNCLSLPQPHPYAANRLGEIARKKKEYHEAVKYHTQAISKNFKQSLLDLGKVYFEINEYDKAELYFRDAVKEHVEGANTFLAKLLMRTDRKKESRVALQTAVEANEDDSHINFARYYLSQKKPNYQKAEFHFREAIAKGETEAYNQLARMHIKKGDIEKAIVEYEAGIACGNAESAHHLGHLYNMRTDFVKSDKMFSKAIEMGKKVVVGCWVESIYRASRKDKKLMAVELLQNYRDENGIDSLPLNLLFARILLWNDRITESENIVIQCINELASLHNENNGEEKYLQQGLTELLEYFLLLIAKGRIHLALEFFQNNSEPDLKVMLKPIYYLVMENMKDEFPNEYLKAGGELVQTVRELQKEVENLKENLI